MACATRSAWARETKFCEFGLPSGGRRSDLHPTRMTGIAWPQMERTSSIHYVVDAPGYASKHTL